MDLLVALGLKPTARRRAQRQAASAAALPGTRQALATNGGSGASSPAVKVGAEVEVVTKEFKPYVTKYGSLKVGATLKITASTALGSPAGSPVGFSGSVSSKARPAGRTTGTKKSFSYRDIADRELFAGFDLKGLSIALETEVSGTDLSVAGSFRFTIATRGFSVPAQAKLTLLTVKGGRDVQGPGVELKIAPLHFKHKAGGTEAAIMAEFKASFTVDLKKVGAEVGMGIVETLAKEMLKKEAERQGVKLLGRKAAEFLLRELGPLAAAFGVGLDIGKLLNAVTVAPQAAGIVYADILGDLNKRYQRAGTLGKMWLLSKNSPKIVAAMVAAGVTGATAGMADLLLFKLMGLERLPDYAEALAEFAGDIGAGLKAVGEALRQGIGATLLYGAIMLGIKTNPSHARVGHAALLPLLAAIHARIRPLYRTTGGYDRLVMLRVKDARPDPASLAAFAAHVLGARLDHGGRIDLTNVASVADALMQMGLADFLGFLQANRLISFTVAVDGNMDPKDIDPALLDELFE